MTPVYSSVHVQLKYMVYVCWCQGLAMAKDRDRGGEISGVLSTDTEGSEDRVR